MNLIKPFERFFPYDETNFFKKIRTVLQILNVKVLDKFAYPSMSLISYFKLLKGFKNDKEFLIRYKKESENFEGLWTSKPRETREQIESFYNEHEKDVWRQVYLSRYGRHKKKYVLMVYNLIKDYSKKHDIKIFDYGCGCGVYGHYLYKKGYKNITFADIESGTFTFLQKAMGSKFKCIKIGNESEILNDDYDVILMIDCLAHAYNPLEATKHVLDHLKKGGLLIMYYEVGVKGTHLQTASQQRDQTINYIYNLCNCLKKDEVFIKK